MLGRVITFDARRLAFGGFGFAGSAEPDGFVPFIAPAGGDGRRPRGRPAQPRRGAAVAVRRRAPPRSSMQVDDASPATAAGAAHCPVLPQRPALARRRRPAARAGPRQSGAGGVGLDRSRRVVMTLHARTRTSSVISRSWSTRKKLYAQGRCRTPSASAGEDQRRARSLLGPAAPAPRRANMAAIPTRPRCARPRSSRTTRAEPGASARRGALRST